MVDDWCGRTACADDPERWTNGDPDLGAIELCLQCPRLHKCAGEACADPEAFGLHAGVVIPFDKETSNSAYRRGIAFKELRRIARGYTPPPPEGYRSRAPRLRLMRKRTL